MSRYGLLGLALLTAGPTGLMAQRQQLAPVTRTLILLLPAPTGVTLSGQAPQIGITWQAVAGALDYAVLRSADPAQPGTPVSPAGLTATSFVDQTAAPATVYYYTITARFSGGTGTAAPVRFDPPPAIVKAGLGTRAPLVTTGGTGSTPPTDDGMPHITGVSDTVIVPGGAPVTIRGLNLWGITAVYFGTGTRGSWSNPRVMPGPVSPTGDALQVTAPGGCVTRGTVELEQNESPYSGNPSTYITQSGPVASQVRLNCALKPVIGGLPLSVHAGGSAIYQGTYLSWVTRVNNLVDGANLSFQITSDNQIYVGVPAPNSQQRATGQIRFQPNFTSSLGSTAASVVILTLPPYVTSASAPMLSPAEVAPVEPGGTLEIAGPGYYTPGPVTVAVDNLPATRLPNPRPGTIAVTVPTGAVHGTVTVTSSFGSGSGTFTMMAGPSTLSGVTPANAPVGGRVVVAGQNLFRARGVCFANAAAGRKQPPVVQPFVVGLMAPQWQQWTNGSVTVDVPAGAGSGVLGLYLPSTPGAATGNCVPGGATLKVS